VSNIKLSGSAMGFPEKKEKCGCAVHWSRSVCLKTWLIYLRVQRVKEIELVP